MPQGEDSTITLNNRATALEAIKRGYQPIPLLTGGKRAILSGWPRLRWSNTPEGLALAAEKFDEWAEEGQGGIGVLCGAPSGDLIDVDLDHPKTRRLKDHFLPPTPMRSGRETRPGTHYWYIAEPGTLQETRTFKLPREREDPDKLMIVEYRSTKAQTALPGNVHPDGDTYTWAGEPWGGEAGPTVVNGRVLALQVALLGFCTLLVNYWPGEGARHETYLALAGGLLRVGEGAHPYWERNAHVVIGAIADATHDDEGAEGRINEVMGSTLRRLKTGQPVAGFGKLGELIGEDVVKQARVILDEIESLAGVPARTSGSLSVEKIAGSIQEREAERVAAIEAAERALTDPQTSEEAPRSPEEENLPPVDRDPLEERVGTWEALDLDPYLTGQVQKVMPSVLTRTDGQALMYPGRLNMLYGPSESAKSWIAMATCLQLMEHGERVVYLDFEDEPVNALERMQLLGAGYDDLLNSFSYVRPEEPLASMQRSRWGEDRSTERGKLNEQIFHDLLDAKDPALIVADGMTVLYSLHGLDSNDSVQTDIITTWLKKLTRNGRSTVIVVDHTAKNPARGSLPIGSQHKVSMVMGSLLQAYPVSQPMPGAEGKVELIVLKDRPGQVRKIAEKSGEKAQLAAEVIIDSRSEEQTILSFRPPPTKTGGLQGSGPKTADELEIDLRQARAAETAMKLEQERSDIIDLFNGDLSKPLAKRHIYETLFGSSQGTASQRKRADRRVKELVERNWLRQEGSTSNTFYYLAVSVVEEVPPTQDDPGEGDDADGKIDVRP